MNPAFWNARYSNERLAYGTEPNAFIADQAERRLPPDAVVIDLGAGEGRNALFLARRGHPVTAVDYSRVGLDKARRLAEAQHLEIETVQTDITRWHPARQWDAVVIAFLHLSPQDRPRLYELIQHLLRPGGLLIAEWFHPDQVTQGYQSGGPRSVAMLITLDELRRHFPSPGILVAEQTIRPLEEGPHHRGSAAVVQFVWEKPGPV